VRFDDIMNVNQIFDYTKNVLLPNIYQQKWYNGRAYPGVEDETLSDEDRARQVRVLFGRGP
jgi:hypothetical protein